MDAHFPRKMRRVRLLRAAGLLFFAATFPAVASGQHSHVEASRLVARALDAMGGAPRIRALRGLQLSGDAFERHLYEAEPPDQPFYLTWQHFSESRDLQQGRFRRLSWTSDSASAQIEKGADSVLEIRQAGTGRATRLHRDWLDLSPERLLLTARAAPDLHTIDDTVISGVRELRVAFTWSRVPVRVWVDAFTDLPSRVDYVQAYPESVSSGAWGDVQMRSTFGAWVLFPGGLHYPTQIETYLNGEHFRSTMLSDVRANPTVPEGDYVISDAARSSARRPGLLNASDIPLGSAARPATEIEPGVVQIPGAWYATLIRQSDGLVVLEAPISAGYSAKVLEFAAHRFPGVPIKAVISTSNYWWHFAGVREYVARGIPVYGLDLNERVLRDIVASPHRLYPDSLEHDRKQIRLHLVSGKTTIGTGANRLELYPVRSSTTSLMLMVYMPQYQLLYSSDMAQPLGPNGSFLFPQYLSDLRREVTRDGLDVQTLIGMHMSPTPWSTLESTLKAIEN